jgi:MFS transporter, FHS family, L-fucose permease
MEKINNQSYKKSFAVLTSLFFMWGFITVMNDILVNKFQGIFDLSPNERSLVQLAFFGAFFFVSLIYFLISSFTGKDPVNKIGYKNGMVVSLFVCGLGCFSFYPAAIMNSYGAFLGALFILATGVTLLQICANPYAAILGSSNTASSRLNLAQGFNSLGTAIGPIIGTILIYQVLSNGEDTVDSIKQSFLIFGVAFVIIAIFVKLGKMPSFVNEEKVAPGIGVLKNRHLLLGVIAIFIYVGSEVSIGTWLVEFLKSDNIMGMKEEDASYFLSFFWGGLMIGRLMASQSLNENLKPIRKYLSMALIGIVVFLFLYIATAVKIDDTGVRFEMLSFTKVYLYLVYLALCFVAFIFGAGKPGRSLMVFCFINAVLLIIAMFSTGHIAMWSVIGTGLFFSIGWSNIFTLAIKDLGKYTSQGSSLLVMAIVGGAVLPRIQSQIIESYDIQTSFIIPLIGMVYLMYYGWKGHKIRK